MSLTNTMPILLAIALSSGLSRAEIANRKSAKQVRRPVAVVATDSGVLVGNRLSGTISLLDISSHQVVAEHSIATRVAGVARVDSRFVIVLDDATGQLLKVLFDGNKVAKRPIAKVGPGATEIRFASGTRQLFVSKKWPRNITAITFDEEIERVTQTKSLVLPFAPHKMLWIDQSDVLLAADSFRGQIAVIDACADELKLRAIREIDGHNIRGLAISAGGSQLHIAHQQLVPNKPADYEELHWGRLVRNAVQVFDVTEFLEAKSERKIAGWLDVHGDIGGATGDPGNVITGPNRATAIAFSGIGEVAVSATGYVKRIEVGTRPEAMAFGHDKLYVANRFSDSISIIDLKKGKLEKTVSLGPTPELSAIQRGEKLFYDAKLSHEGWVSCHSCHTDGHSSGLLVDTLGDGDYGAPKRVPSLLGTRNTGPWGWTGKAASLDEQVRKSVTTTMHGEIDDQKSADLVAYLESLGPPPTRYHETRELVADGRIIFNARGCVDCHKSPTFTSKRTFNVGLTDERKRTLFNPPSLRGVSQRQRFFHDGRAATLEEVFLKVKHQLESPLSERELLALLAYLRSL